MSMMTVLGQPAVLTRKVTDFIERTRNALQKQRRRGKLRAALYGMNSRDLHDIGIAHSDIEYLASHPEIDPRDV
ncbi:uncharacterized protein YjiS (DUF1127 family) [Bradyrhizobium sp. cir1]|uniref:DUF1127 domain-containing protein n=1 Tax=Bradyrhizobium sp. cir1 TaxID=1445730 RepID=UPI0016057B9C|nr:DUF1127 domain-containing protein [Bradyrhizobium sp. cir1]MBB4370311.1 uncharacterized protein YjiS (DUF1127 family) [Bradyrhizobium sp. cir1]